MKLKISLNRIIHGPQGENSQRNDLVYVTIQSNNHFIQRHGVIIMTQFSIDIVQKIYFIDNNKFSSYCSVFMPVNGIEAMFRFNLTSTWESK